MCDVVPFVPANTLTAKNMYYYYFCESGYLYVHRSFNVTNLTYTYFSSNFKVSNLILDVDELSSRSFHAPISDQYLSSLFLNEFVHFNHVLWQRVPAITDSDTEECLPDGFGTSWLSWDVNFHRI